MTERLLSHGVFPILSQRPLDDSEVESAPLAKVYVVEVGAYSNRYVDAIFTTRELAQGYIDSRAHRDFERYLAREERHPGQVRWTTGDVSGPHTLYIGIDDVRQPLPDGVVIPDNAEHIPGPVIPKVGFDEWFERHNEWNEYGTVDEYDLWDMVPIVKESA